MKVKIGGVIYDSSEVPIMITFEYDEKELISNMDENNHNFCSFPYGMTVDQVKEFMGIE